jgi:predicted transcriptional regulator of viral defense system
MREIEQQMKAPAIWRKVLFDGKKVVTSKEIMELAGRLGKGRERSLSYLQEHGYIVRIARGVYYVRSADERERGFFDWSVYEMVAAAMGARKIRRWYFGLETALKLNGMTHEYFAVDSVVTDSAWTSKPVGVLGARFHFFKWGVSHFGFGLVRKGGLIYSDPEKTVLDLAYRAHRRKGTPMAIIGEYIGRLDRVKLSNYLKRYPVRFQNALGELP